MAADERLLRPFPLRLSKSLREKATQLASKDGVSLNHFICLAVAEKLVRLEPEVSAPKGGPRSNDAIKAASE